MAQAEYTTEVLADSPTAFWKLDESSGLPQDSSGNGNHFTATAGSPTYQAAGPFSGAFGITYAAGDSHTRAVFSTAVNNITCEVWINGPATNNTTNILGNGQNGTSGYRILTTVGAVYARATVLCEGGPGSQGLGPPQGGVGYQQFVAVRRSNTWEYYVNGDVFNSNAGTGAPNTPATSCGISPSAQTVTVSNWSLYETALSAARIRTHYEAAIDYTQRTLNRQVRGNLVLA